MNTQISILVKRTFSDNFMNKVEMQIDNKSSQILKASGKPYIFDITPGNHTLYFNDKRQGFKKNIRKAYGCLFGLGIGLASGVSGFGESFGNLFGGNKEYNSQIDISVNEGDIVKLSVKTTNSGKVKIKQLK